ncbi:tripartite tricarboxylate transporter substrate binding protein [Ottowia caeni]|uniref:Bug family tripartite tricarboxylate transporter substrate binding protein n=1 Tax=Ottowia caeni TaxID=2870339 RepID=UPI001E4EF7B5|nr:tripartite tricarboxylate transporter substrate binding protein [Ottowia caeni]
MNLLKRFFVGLTLGVTLAGVATAQNYPQRPIQLVVPVSAGGGTDVLARNVGQKVAELLGQQIVVENKTGAGGNIGVEYVAKAKADGYTLLFSPNTIATNVAVYRKLPYDLLRDFKTVALVGQTDVALVVNNNLKATNVKEFVDLARSRPGALNYGSAGMGSSQHLTAEYFNQMANTRSNHIPYKGQSQAMNDLVGGQLDYMFSPLQNALPFIKQGRIRVLAVAAKQRHRDLPQTPTLIESGYAGAEVANWFALYAPADTPSGVVKTLHSAYTKVLKQPEFKSKLESMGFDIIYATPEQATDFMRSELVRWTRVAAHAGIKAE